MLRLILVALAYKALAMGAFRYPDFNSTDNLKFAGGAKRSGTAIRLTIAQQHLAGALWYQEKQQLATGFETTFQFQLTHQDSLHFQGADGFAFVLQTVGPKAVAGQGSAGGFALSKGPIDGEIKGIPNSLAIFFDTYQNDKWDDPSGNYVAICTNADGYWPPRRLAYTRFLSVHLKDRKVHTARIVYRPPQLSVFIDDQPKPILHMAIQMANVTDSEGAAFVGFTAATGNGYQNHDILSWSFGPLSASDSSAQSSDSAFAVVTSSISFNPHPCLAARTLCTPDGGSAQERGEGQFHIILPANVEWGASIPNPARRKVTLLSVTGTVCRDPRAAASNLCSEAIPGSILMKTLLTKTGVGVTSFSISGSTAQSEGYFEFDVRLQ